MTDEQINERITEVTGLWDHPYSSDTRRMMDFCTDLNAMHEVEKSLPEKIRVTYVRKILSEVADSHEYMWDIITANPRSRAEAFLRTLGKWEDSK